MNAVKILLVTLMLGASSIALAEGGGDRVFARMAEVRESAMAAYKAKAASQEATEVAQEGPTQKPKHC
ncbi:co-regulatory protein PtrA N-terminal domain-containing protein [Pseudomonas alliivorans]|uniref:Secreted protein n=1 Tax=Pseudomonas cannabina pv. alisalensis TaxID=757414 RepID=A0ABS1X7U6_PSEC1|nr:co-regulatory protein PtrA N-terminal domain-containing protein [Pseudomonas cannabina]MEE4964490.1 co-regulatory protein PtrA N-terminal domain-containing protein [Pseudomonas alliivorans]MBM0137550.1 hypothetical protein [Pseudomonas cannabina pv. alisalensis]MEE4974573.1 co-regulatory protein PtrA N-terminal domain-containing protein [Pseudomonas alliivorans]MEE4979722.1 co-regulatory protein PtrA N-terminal domain-containing protein [Pseudomonas alliivorans]MEE4984825.1 co-regulatory pr